MSDFYSKMHPNRLRQGLTPYPAWRAYKLPQTPSWNKGDLLIREGRDLSKRKRRRGRGQEEKKEKKGSKGEREGEWRRSREGKKREEREGKERLAIPILVCVRRRCLQVHKCVDLTVVVSYCVEPTKR